MNWEIFFFLGMIFSGLIWAGYGLVYSGEKIRDINWKLNIVLLLVFIVFVIGWGRTAKADEWSEAGHNSSTGYHQCLACHNGKPVPRLVLQSPLGARTQILFRRFKECWKDGDQGCMDQIAVKAGSFVRGAKHFWQRVREESR